MRRRLVAATALLLAGISSSLAMYRQPRLALSDYCNGTDSVDDTGCITEWIEAGHTAGKKLYAPPGTYLYRETMPVYSGLDLLCDRSQRPTFRRSGGSRVFLQAPGPVRRVRIQGCGFDVKGSTESFLAVIDISPDSPEPSREIEVRGNRIYDSAILGTMSSEQRQYILLLNCRECTVEGNHDNAITMVDGGSGVSEDITIENNRIVSPKAIGIFFGADGENETAASLTTRNVRISRNHIEGDWTLACILGTLPAITRGVYIDGNTCVKSGPAAQSSAGISIKRTNDAPGPARLIRVERNRVSSSPSSGSEAAALDHCGVSFSGSHSDVTIKRNEVRNVGGRAMLLRGDIRIAEVLHNILVGGVLQIEGTVQGQVQEPYTLGGSGSVID
jgi:hypothetical protein